MQKKALEKVMGVLPFPTSAETEEKEQRHQIDIKKAKLIKLEIRKPSKQAVLRLG